MSHLKHGTGADFSVTVICPLFNAEKDLETFHNSLNAQSVDIKEIRYILTESTDRTEEFLDKIANTDKKVIVEAIKKSEFSHSLTRENAAMKANGNILVFLTQDVKIKDPDFIKKLTTPIVESRADASYARQISKYSNIEKYTRECNYPKTSKIVSRKDLKELGLKTFFFSDAASAISAKKFKDLKGYDGKKLPISEDMYFAYKLIMDGGKIAYVAEAEVFHSHKFTLKQIRDRYKLTGQFFKENSYLDQYGTTNSGATLAKYVLKRILQNFRIDLLFRFPFDMGARYFGMKAGKR